ncbi:family 43 glycosylhydrolase [Sanguibacter sp. 25GB23B1]|uniref:family 43 glycosylhydrolase n=1 Tax=unclassified Sanguibacter TaxID=2645534 RepID=UPI0032AF6516
MRHTDHRRTTRMRTAATALLAACLALGGTATASTGAAAERPASPVAASPVAGNPVAGNPTSASPVGATSSLLAEQMAQRIAAQAVDGDTTPIHDPALIVDGSTWWVFGTGRINRENGGTIQMWSSTNAGTTWRYRGTVWNTIPAWIDQHFAGGALPDNLWAPEVYEHDGTFYLYYSASRFGTNTSVTALATNTTLDPTDPAYRWVDAGLVVASPATGLPGGKSFNAIDAGIVESGGKPYMSIGSFFDGIFLVPLQWPSGKVAVADWAPKTVQIADRRTPGNAIEAPYITQRGGYYYLFTSFDSCCKGTSSTYKIAVGRSTSVTGPYVDKAGRSMLDGGGTVLLSTSGNRVGPGGQSVYGDNLAFHYYDAEKNGVPTLAIETLTWVDGWPTLGGSSGGTSSTSILRNAHTGTCLDVATSTPGTAATVWSCNTFDNQRWTRTASGELRVFGSQCLDASGRGTTPGTAVIIWGCAGSTNQQWVAQADGSIRGVQSGLCLDVAGWGTANGTKLQL